MTTDFALGQLRHLYSLMLAGHVKDTAEAARGLLGPSIAAFERGNTTSDDVERAATLAWNEAIEAAIALVRKRSAIYSQAANENPHRAAQNDAKGAEADMIATALRALKRAT